VRARRLQHRADPLDRLLQVRVPPAADGGGAGGRLDQVEEHPQRRGLAGPVRPEEAGHTSRLDLERQVIYRSDLRVQLGQMGDDDLSIGHVLFFLP
jgi:hypothetical protein